MSLVCAFEYELSRTRWGPAHAIDAATGAFAASMKRYRAQNTRHRRRSLPIVYLIYLAFQVDPEEVGAGGIY